MGRTSCAAAAAIALLTAGVRTQDGWGGVLDQHPAIAYAARTPADRVAKLGRELADGTRTLHRDSRTGYLAPLLQALGIPIESQLLVFSKTGVQRAFTSPRNPRALYFDSTVAVGYVPGAPAIEVASHDPQQGVVFYVVDQSSAAPALTRRTSCLSCHVSASTLDVPGMISRSNFVGEDGNTMPQLGGGDVTHRTPHPDRWGGWYVTSEGVPPPYAQRAHAGNITFSPHGDTSNQIFTDWLNGAPDDRPYLSSSSDIVALLLFDHQMHAINLLTRLNWEWRVAAAGGRASVSDAAIRPLVDELAGYLLFEGEAPLGARLTPMRSFADYLASRVPTDHRGRSFGQLDLGDRLLRYPCSYMVYSPAFDALAPPVKDAVYRRMIGMLSAPPAGFPRLTADDRTAIVEILRETRPDFP